MGTIVNKIPLSGNSKDVCRASESFQTAISDEECSHLPIKHPPWILFHLNNDGSSGHEKIERVEKCFDGVLTK